MRSMPPKSRNPSGTAGNHSGTARELRLSDCGNRPEPLGYRSGTGTGSRLVPSLGTGTKAGNRIGVPPGMPPELKWVIAPPSPITNMLYPTRERQAVPVSPPQVRRPWLALEPSCWPATFLFAGAGTPGRRSLAIELRCDWDILSSSRAVALQWLTGPWEGRGKVP
jgi:hypothetical protein